MTVKKDFFQLSDEIEPFLLLLYMKNLGVQQKHRYKYSIPDCLLQIILFMITKARGQ